MSQIGKMGVLVGEKSFRDTLKIKDYSGDTINTDYHLSESVIKNVANYNYKINKGPTVFNKFANFSNTDFLENALFIETNFNNDAYFVGTYFKKEADFFDTKFSQVVDFREAVFKKKLYMNGTHFYDNISFERAQLPDTLFLSNVKIAKDVVIDFRLCRIDSLNKYYKNKKCVIILSQTDISKTIIPSELFKIAFLISDNFDERSRIFQGIIKKCKDVGLSESEQMWEIEYKKEVNFHFLNYIMIGPYKGFVIYLLPFGYILNFINEYWWNFGYDKGLIFWFWLPVFYLFFSIINFFNLDWLYKNVYKDDEIGKNFNLNFSKLFGLKERISFTLFYTAIIYFNFKLKHEAVNYKNLKGVLYLYLIYIIGSLHVAFGIFGYIIKT